MGPNALAMALAVILAAGASAAAEPILGDWRTEDGETVRIRRCGGAYCARVATGSYRGHAIGRVAGPGPEYRGKIVDPRSGKVWTGSMTVRDRRLDLKGCLMDVFCKTVQRWTRA